MGARASLFLIAVAAATTPAFAQEHNGLAVGINFSHHGSIDPLAHGDFGVGLKWRLGHGDEGWAWHYGLSWYATNIEQAIDVGSGAPRTVVPIGELKIRPLLAGYGYTHVIGPRLLMITDIVGGFAYASLDSTDESSAALARLPTGPVHLDVGAITPVVKPEFSIWYDVKPRFGVSVDVGYIIARPHITVATGNIRESGRFRADTFSLSAGFVFRLLER